jgi:hypothetical protein
VEQVTAQGALLADADVLIDFAGTEPSLLALIAQNLGPLKVARQVLETVANLSASDCMRYGIEVVELETDILLEATAGVGRLSFEDRLSLLVCRDRRWICVTNDAALRAECESEGVGTKRGLRLLLDLVHTGHLSKSHALRAAKAIAESNPRHIHAGVLAAFHVDLDAI